MAEDMRLSATEELRRLHIGDQAEPLAAASLAALIDLGMSDEMIAKYFRTDSERVAGLLIYFGLLHPRDRRVAASTDTPYLENERT